MKHRQGKNTGVDVSVTCNLTLVLCEAEARGMTADAVPFPSLTQTFSYEGDIPHIYSPPPS